MFHWEFGRIRILARRDFSYVGISTESGFSLVEKSIDSGSGLGVKLSRFQPCRDFCLLVFWLSGL